MGECDALISSRIQDSPPGPKRVSLSISTIMTLLDVGEVLLAKLTERRGLLRSVVNLRDAESSLYAAVGLTSQEHHLSAQ